MDISQKVVVAPMVRGSELAFRKQIRTLYPGMLCYSPMLRVDYILSAFDAYTRNKVAPATEPNSDVIKKSKMPKWHEDAKLFLYDSCKDDTPLVIQICGSSPDKLYQACKAILCYYPEVFSHSVEGIDLNLGCPQSCAKDGNFGAFLAENYPDLAVDCIKAMKRAIDDFGTEHKVRLSCKIRLFESLDRTIAFARSLQAAGCELITVHCRLRTCKFDGQADLQAGKALVEELDIPVWINGAEVRSEEEVDDVMQKTGAARLMIARDFLADPRLFHPEKVATDVDSTAAFQAAEYLDYAIQARPPTFHFLQIHMRWFFRKSLQPEGKDDFTNWRHRLWNFLYRPYLHTIEQYRHIIVYFVTESQCTRPASLKDITETPTPKTIRHLHKKKKLTQTISHETAQESKKRKTEKSLS